MPNRITMNDSTLEVITKLSQGNPGAVTVLCQWLENGAKIDPDACHPLIQMCSLDDMDIVGPKIWMLYKDVCNHDLRVMLGVLRAHQLGFLSTERLLATLVVRNASSLDENTIADLLAQVENELPNFQKEQQT